MEKMCFFFSLVSLGFEGLFCSSLPSLTCQELVDDHAGGLMVKIVVGWVERDKEKKEKGVS